MTPKENNILIQAREVYKNHESEYYLETIRKTADELERTLSELEELKRDVKRYFELRNLKHYPFAFGSELSLELFNLREKLEKVGKEK